jgi:aminomethyltransferase
MERIEYNPPIYCGEKKLLNLWQNSTMPIPTPFHPRTFPLCESYEWRDWAGYLAAASYHPSHEHEYFAIRNSAALIDVSPLFKYEITGPQAGELLNRIITRDISKCAVGQIFYTPWCDDDGKVIDDGTVSRLDEYRYRITAAEPNFAWFQDCAIGFHADIHDRSKDLAALAIQGPSSRKILNTFEKLEEIENLGYYRLFNAVLDSFPLTISRTGYTGDLGYELWVEPENATRLWDFLMQAGRNFGLIPVGMQALDIARIEAGLILIQIDYISSRKAMIEAQKSSPYEIGLGWTVDLKKPNFIGKKALMRDQSDGVEWKLVGLEVDWPSLEKEFGRQDLVPQVVGRSSRSALPVYIDNRQVGYASSHTFSPVLKSYIALASLERKYIKPGTELSIEITVEYTRRRARARVVKLPFINPPRKKS